MGNCKSKKITPYNLEEIKKIEENDPLKTVSTNNSSPSADSEELTFRFRKRKFSTSDSFSEFYNLDKNKSIIQI
jgi:hypothetical protein